MKTFNNIMVSSFVVLLLSACSERPNYVHTEPDAHPIPANRNVAMPEIVEEERSRGNLVIEEESAANTADTSTFINKYHEKNKPKFIIYINKELEEISVDNSELLITFNSDNTMNQVFKFAKTETTTENDNRYYKRFMDKIEKAYITAFLDNKVKVIDRNYLLRSQEVKYDKADQTKRFSVLEMDALKEQASIFISVVPVFSRDKIEMDVKAIDLLDGHILFDYTAELTRGSTREIVLTHNGYEVKRGANLDKSMQGIAKESMSKIGKTW